MKPTGPQLFHKESLAWIKSIESASQGTLKKSGPFSTDFTLELESNKKSIAFSFDHSADPRLQTQVDLGHYNNQLPIEVDGKSYLADRIHFHHYTLGAFSGTVGSLKSPNFRETKPVYNRAIIPLKKKLQFSYQVDQIYFETDLGYGSRTGTKCKIATDDLFVLVIHDKAKNDFLSIESSKKQPHKQFIEKAYAARNALAYISGYYAGDKCYSFTYTQRKMSSPAAMFFQTIRHSIYGNYTPINSNSHAWLHYDKVLADKWYQSHILRPLSIPEFSNLAHRIYSNEDFGSAVVLILESSVASLLFMPGGFAIALETIAPMISQVKKRTLAPITTKCLWRSIRKDLLKVIEAHKPKSQKHDYDVLEGKINNLNAPTNKAKLISPFNELGISLLKEDLDIIATRNDFLHGRAPDITDAGKSRSLDRINNDLYYCSLRLYTLLAMLILKWIGYDSYVLNYPKIQELATQIPLSEEPYRKV